MMKSTLTKLISFLIISMPNDKKRLEIIDKNSDGIILR